MHQKEQRADDPASESDIIALASSYVVQGDHRERSKDVSYGNQDVKEGSHEAEVLQSLASEYALYALALVRRAEVTLACQSFVVVH